MAIADLIVRASNGTAPVATTLAANKAAGASSATLTLATGWSSDPHFVLYQVSVSGTEVAGTRTIWRATLSGTTLSNMTLRTGTEPSGGYPAGSVAEPMFTSAMADDLAIGVLVHSNADGTMKSGLTYPTPTFTGTMTFPTGGVPGTALAASGTTPEKLLAGTGTSWVWQSWTPTWTNLTVGNGTLSYAKYIQVGKTVYGRLHFIWGSTTSASGGILFSPPTSFNGDISTFTRRAILSTVEMRDDSAGTSVFGELTYNSTSTVVVQAYTVSGTAISLSNATNTQPFTWATNDIISCTFSYEAG